MKRLFFIPFLLIVFQCATTQSDSFIIELPFLKRVNKTVGIQLFQAENMTVNRLAERTNDFYIDGLKQDEIVALNHSLYGTLVKNNLFRSVESVKSTRKKLDLQMDWMIRDYMIVATGSQVCGAANISYCLINSKGRVVFQEDFSVAAKNYHCLIKTVKTKLNSAIVNRLVVRLANWYRRKSPRRLALPAEYNGVGYYRTYRAAAAIFPPETKINHYLPNQKSSGKLNWSEFLTN